tara:strand:+ start:543 stop:1409 length:867 start_codon:yes stop_codon:yes gene_type:complete
MIDKKMKRIDLQMHTHYSDGKFSPKDVIDMALKKGMKAIAITDHDSVKGIEEGIEYSKDKDIEFVLGIELSCREEFYDGTIDILGLFIDHENEELKKFVERDRERRRIEKKEMVEKLNNLGYEISFDELVRESGESMGRPTIARILFKKYPGKFESVNDVFKKLIGEGKEGYVHREKTSVSEAMGVIHNAGGVSVLAHPGRYIRDLDGVVDKFIENGGKAIEVYYPYAKLFRVDEIVERGWIDRFKRIVEDKNLLVSGGSDFHDFERGSEIGDAGISDEEFERLKNFR